MAKWVKYKKLRSDFFYYIDLEQIAMIQVEGDEIFVLFRGGEQICILKSFATEQIIKYFEDKSIPIEKLGVITDVI